MGGGSTKLQHASAAPGPRSYEVTVSPQSYSPPPVREDDEEHLLALEDSVMAAVQSGVSPEELAGLRENVRVLQAALTSELQLAKLRQMEEFLQSVGSSLSEGGHAKKEGILRIALESHFELIEIFRDGNCPFLSVYVGLLAAELLSEGRPWRDVCGALHGELEDYGQAFMNAETMRASAIDAIRANLPLFREDISVFLCNCLTSADTDDTTSRIREELRKRFPGRCSPTQLAEECSAASPGAVEAYLAVMGTAGVFGERLELRALALHLSRPIHLFYFVDDESLVRALTGAGGDTPPPPIEVFDELGAVREAPAGKTPAEGNEAAAGACPIFIYHEVAGRHFHVLVPLPRARHMDSETISEHIADALDVNSRAASPVGGVGAGAGAGARAGGASHHRGEPAQGQAVTRALGLPTAPALPPRTGSSVDDAALEDAVTALDPMQLAVLAQEVEMRQHAARRESEAACAQAARHLAPGGTEDHTGGLQLDEYTQMELALSLSRSESERRRGDETDADLQMAIEASRLAA